MAADLKALLTFIAKGIVDDPDMVSVELIDKEELTTLELRVAKDDMGKVIGRNGRMAKDIRTIVRAASRDRKKVHVDIVDKE